MFSRGMLCLCGSLLLLLLVIAGCQSGDSAFYTSVAPVDEQQTLAGGLARKIVVFDATAASETAQDAIITRTGATKVRSLALINAAVVHVGPAGERALRGQAGVVRIEDDVLVQAQAIKLPLFPTKTSGETLPWGVDRIDAERVWDVDGNKQIDAGANAGGRVKVAVIDTGIDLTHPDLRANIIGGVNIIDPRKNAADDNGHGTHVAGIIAGVDNTVGVLGVAPEVSLYAVKVLNRQGSGYLSDIIKGIEWSIANNAQVINMSLGTSSSVQSFHDAVKKAYAAGIVVVAAAGNSGPGSNTVLYPAKYPEVIAVSATDKADAIASFSSRGPEVELAAPGVAIYSTYRGSAYKELSGTSMAAPHVAGVAALVIAAGISGPDAVRTRLRATADEKGASGVDNLYGYGLVDAEEAATGAQTSP